MTAWRGFVARAVMVTMTLGVSAASADDDPDPVEVTRERGAVFHDGKGHFLTFAMSKLPVATGNPGARIAYGTRKTLHFLGGASTSITYSKTDAGELISGTWGFWDPRIVDPWNSFRPEMTITPREVVVRCSSERSRTFTLATAADAKAVLAKATFLSHRKRQPNFLGRDQGTTYFYVDVEDSDYHVYSGKRGAMRQLKVRDLAVDTAGAVFITTTGTLQLTLSRDAYRAATWKPAGKGKAKAAEPLIVVPVTDQLVYRVLDVYAGVRFGTPCDDI